MRITLNNKVYDILSRISRYYIPFFASVYILVSNLTSIPYLADVLTVFILISLVIGLILLIVRLRWRTNDTLIIDDREGQYINFGLESGRRIEDLHHDKVMTIRVRRLGEPRDENTAYSDHQ